MADKASALRPKVIGVIPARWNSSRFPGKPLALIAKKSLLERTYENALCSAILDDLIIATDDLRIVTHALSFGAKALMTSSHHSNGTERLAEIVQKEQSLPSTSLIVNIQGDEPVLPKNAIESVVTALLSSPCASIATAITPLTSIAELKNPSIVKCVTKINGEALYFSRSAIPFKTKSATEPNTDGYFRHIGLYCYRKDFLLRYASLPETPLQLSEDLEQLKAIEHGYTIQTALISHGGIGVDTPEDIIKVEEFLCRQNLFS